ncbi:flagellin N-terminal helical domain-containing protein [Halomonas sp. MES3-P3E]|uniref:flagellin N-terminal helical domain-containing protein n=1 Tax=Halomonas sp. MES3-P3E TaxID=2058321 RepID=UPI000C34E27A|nr:flagellin [Halomonas sp. MES3-P3E]PKG50334.1 hypothetical protein CXF87_11280 [Halomonas sp. MES3-P3E]
MASIINTNISALIAQQNRSGTQSSLATAMERLSSGLRVNSAKDDAAGQAIGNRMSSQISGQHQAARNANDGVSLVQTAEGVLSSINDKLQRVRELTVQGLNGTITAADADAIQAEINQNLQEIDRLAEQTEFNGLPLLDGQVGKLNLQIGAQDGQQLAVDLGKASFNSTALGLEDFTVYGLEGEITPRDTLLGSANDIVLRPGAGAEVSTKLEMYVNGVLQDNATTEYVRARGANGGPSNVFAGRYIQTQVSDKPQYYYYSPEFATHYTETDHNEVTLSANSPVFVEPNSVAIPASSQQSFQLTDGTSLSSGISPKLVSGDGQYYIQSQEDGLTVYREAEVNMTSDGISSSFTAKAIDTTVYTRETFPLVQPEEPITVNENGTPTSNNYDTYSSVNFIDATGTALASGTSTLVSYNGNNYIQHTDGGTTKFFEAALSSTDGVTLSVKALESEGLTQAPFSSQSVVSSFAFDSSALDYTNAGTDASNARLLNDIFHDSGYYVEAEDGSGYEYYHASLSLNARDTSTSTASVDFTSTEPERFESIEKIDGSSVVKLDEQNVEVNYTVQNEDGITTTYNDVLRKDTEGRYYMRLSNDAESDTESFLKATLTDNLKTGDTLVQTSKGSSNVLVYFDFDSLVSTEADLLQAGSDEKRTVINITADSDEIRIKNPSDPLATLDRAISRIDGQRSYLGAVENRLGSAIDNLETISTNLTSARSRIMDADYAVEVSSMTKAQILQQASTSVLAQANQIPQNVLSLLG